MIRLIKNVIFFLVIVVLISCNKNEYIVYRPHYLSSNHETKFYGKPELDTIEFKNTIQVLEFYNETFETKNGNLILISEELANNWELLWNYTTKSKDENWLKTHIRQ